MAAGIGMVQETNIPGAETPLPRWKSWDQCMQLYKTLKETSEKEYSTCYTNIETAYCGLPDSNSVTLSLKQIRSSNSPDQKSRCLNQYMAKSFKRLAPKQMALWLLNQDLWDRAHEFFSTELGQGMTRMFKSSLDLHYSTETDLLIYAEATEAFRNHCAPLLGDVDTIFGTSKDDSRVQITVGHDAITNLFLMLKFISDYRNVLDNDDIILNYRRQRDIIFNFFLWVEAMRLPEERRLYLNRFLWMFGRRIMGSREVRSALRRGPLNRLLSYMNLTGSMYVPPYALTTERMYDMVAVYGVLSWGELRESFDDPGISPLYAEHLKRESGAAMTFITNYWEMEKESTKQNSLESVDMLDQLFLNKMSAYENTNQKSARLPDIIYCG